MWSVKAAAMLSLLVISTSSALAAIALDRTRVIYNADDKAVSLSISNQNTKLPYLAQGWLENEHGEKVTSPLVVLPPLQRVEPGEKGQIKIQALPAAGLLPQDRETLFYFNLREVPPRSDKPNTLQIALQTSIKLFYRPPAIVAKEAGRGDPWQHKLTLTQRGDRYEVNNPTPYYITLVDAKPHASRPTVAGFEPLMIAPRSKALLGGSIALLGHEPVLTYVNDYGGRPELLFRCADKSCRVQVKS
ncbi:fimbria/pilus periplasmic chaperone [Erwiniaceae bacterium BAC15a-03b]|uniref:Fimbria/pilus periplasmic chaperone n=2 Tax=Winslowiella arboricola TaxID=2978220 RepID=A0A9J6PGU6_9GAMM|nr:fimbria/pilus periplasmic chaperone [Winslowiella arboricola]MCU5775918.1 fimbria/pilus periplasmic chaperone [Winslowiella arboricola]